MKLLFGLLLCSLFSVAQAVDKTKVEHSYLNESSAQIERVTREQWGLNEIEWGKYQQLMRGIRGSLSVESISPLEVLGIHAEGDKERKKYALAWAKVMREDTEKVLKFQFAYDDAAKQLNGNSQIIDMQKLKQIRDQAKANKPRGLEISDGDRVLLFVRLNDCSRCESKILNIRRQLDNLKKVQLDIYFTDTTKGKDDKKLRDWSQRNGLDRRKLIKGKITLNHDKQLINKYFGFTSSVPIAAILRGNQLLKL
ncbi:MAG: TIGR03759 family integrating conjugative element protein [Kofleriaceae bacterium]|nr:TIGR03759 family integrating conjugative element protein [Kofleriaceae bacterium]